MLLNNTSSPNSYTVSRMRVTMSSMMSSVLGVMSTITLHRAQLKSTDCNKQEL